VDGAEFAPAANVIGSPVTAREPVCADFRAGRACLVRARRTPRPDTRDLRAPASRVCCRAYGMFLSGRHGRRTGGPGIALPGRHL